MSGRAMTAAQFGLAYVVVLVALLVLDGIWLGLVTKGLYQREMGALMADPIRTWPAFVFYALYPLAVAYLVLASEPASMGVALLRGATLGLAAYGAYNMTNLAIVKGWPTGLSFIDWTWGGVVTAVIAAVGHWAVWVRGVE